MIIIGTPGKSGAPVHRKQVLLPVSRRPRRRAGSEREGGTTDSKRIEKTQDTRQENILDCPALGREDSPRRRRGTPEKTRDPRQENRGQAGPEKEEEE
ncbi:hypothetical protein NDU88_005605 [Pleurodeles waltl]|uniref:Uncharacterized protein n=1 Tax=Pleurodeles waltl TaxID=8319 RepID=A0AAV7VJJ1_PLEWA|nr:hypothetical protein NDU88_005605 [Pleurodeles waltl]